MNLRKLSIVLFCLLTSTTLFGTPSQALFQAVRSHDSQAAALALQQGANVFCRTTRRRTPLHEAAVRGNVAIIKLLLNSIRNAAQKIEYLECKDQTWNTALHLASDQGHIAAVNMLTDQGSNPHAEDEDDNTPLHLATKSGHHNIVWYFITLCKLDPNLQNQSGNTPLHIATAEGHERIVRYLITEANASMETINRSGWKPIHLAATFNRCTIMRYLLGKIKEKRQTISLGDSPMTRNGRNPLHLATRKNHPKMVALLLAETDEYVNKKDRFGDTPLHLAARERDSAIARLLVENGALSDLKNQGGKTPAEICFTCHIPSSQHIHEITGTTIKQRTDMSYWLGIAGKIDATTADTLDHFFMGWRTYLAARERAVHEILQEPISVKDLQNLIMLFAGPHYPSDSEQPAKKQRTEYRSASAAH